MQKWAHHIKVSVFCKPEESYEEIKQGLIKLFPFNLEEEKLKIEESKAESFSDREIRILDVFIKKETHTQAFLKNLMAHLAKGQKELLRRNAEILMDEEFHFMIDLDKNLMQNDQYWVVNRGPCYHIRIRMAAFPAKRERALDLVDNMLLSGA